ncbi:MAG TPA: helix-turn-helix domain-containing protein, partial [Nocardioides sp.]|nr:helix-turn-helix domain-containing protein [Nocardioides sp.]
MERPSRAPGRPPRRAGLSPDRIAQAALEVVDTEGLDALTVRAVAARLEVAPSALYKHLAGMDALLDLVLDRIVSDVDVEVVEG